MKAPWSLRVRQRCAGACVSADTYDAQVIEHMPKCASLACAQQSAVTQARLAGGVRACRRGSLAVAPLAQRGQRLRLAIRKAAAGLPCRQHCCIPASPATEQILECPTNLHAGAIVKALAMVF